MIAVIDNKTGLAVFKIQDDRLIERFSDKNFNHDNIKDIKTDLNGKVWFCDVSGRYSKIN